MTKRQTEALGFVGALLLLFAFIWWGVVQGNAQQLEKQKQVSWEAAFLPSVFPSLDMVRVDVIDTGSVCIWVSRGHTNQMVVIPKSQLPQGRGCQ